MANDQTFKRFLLAARQRTGWNEDYIRDALRAHFGAHFDSTMTQQYMGHLLALRHTQWDVTKGLEKYLPKPCPICGKPARGVSRIRDGFECGGKLHHYWQWRVNNICRAQGLEIPFEEVEVERVMDDIRTVDESGRSGSRSDTGTDSSVGTERIHSQESNERGTPARINGQE